MGANHISQLEKCINHFVLKVTATVTGGGDGGGIGEKWKERREEAAAAVLQPMGKTVLGSQNYHTSDLGVTAIYKLASHESGLSSNVRMKPVMKNFSYQSTQHM